jgi:hypothetical protein
MVKWWWLLVAVWASGTVGYFIAAFMFIASERRGEWK